MNKPSIMKVPDLSKRIIQFLRKKTVILICFLLFDAIIFLNYVFYFYTKDSAMISMLIRLSGFIIYCITAFFAYKNIKIGVRLMSFFLFINGVHCFILSFFFGLSQFIPKVTGLFAGLYWIYGAIILFNEERGECGKEG